MSSCELPQQLQEVQATQNYTSLVISPPASEPSVNDPTKVASINDNSAHLNAGTGTINHDVTPTTLNDSATSINPGTITSINPSMMNNNIASNILNESNTSIIPGTPNANLVTPNSILECPPTHAVPSVVTSSATVVPVHSGVHPSTHATLQIILTPHPHDVLSGRGASVNAHSGNRHFRTLCWTRKPQFDVGNHVTKRQIAKEIVHSVRQHLNPPGRFLKKIDILDNKMKRVAWEEMGEERSILKACQVMRDVNRPDRINWTEEKDVKTSQDEIGFAGVTPKRRKMRATPVPVGEAAISSKDNLLLNPASAKEGYAITAGSEHLNLLSPAGSVVATAPVTSHSSTNYEHCGEGLIPHNHDVLSGRGAFVNAHHGNKYFRTLALERKPAFDLGNYADKRALAADIVQVIRSLDPPGRFLRRSVKDEKDMSEHRGPWFEIGDERAVHKACQVMRDLRRPDRMGNLDSSNNATSQATIPTVPLSLEVNGTNSVIAQADAIAAVQSDTLLASTMNLDATTTAEAAALDAAGGISMAAITPAPITAASISSEVVEL